MKQLLFIITIIISSLTFAQDPVISLNITTKDDDTGKKLDGATIEVRTGGKVFVTKTSASNGKVPPIDLPLGKDYTVIIKKPGYVPKVATIRAYFDYPEDLPPFVPFNFQTSLFRDVEGVDFSWMETTPLIKFELDQYGQQTWDNAYTNDMLDKIEKLKKEIQEKREEEEKKREEFDNYVASGDKALGKEEYQEAITNYDKALTLFDDADVKKKRDDAQKALDARNAAQEQQKKFEEKMEAAKNAYDGKKYEEAIKLYEEASKIKPDESLPKDRIKEIQDILAEQQALNEKFNKFVADGDAAMNTEDFDKAISNYESALGLKDDEAVKKKLEDAKKAKEDKEAAEEAAKEKEEKYNNLMADADKAFDSKEYEEAKTKYQEALDLKPNESKPAARISEIDDILKKQKEAEEAAKKLEADYKKFIDEGDAAFDSGKWDEAIGKYQEALKLKPNEQHPKDRIEEAKAKKAEAEANAEQEKKFNDLMAEAKGLKDAEKYQEAIDKYKEAQNVKPDASEPKTKIEEIEKIMEDLKAAEEKQAQYEAFMKEGNDAQTAQNLETALGKYKKAIEVKPNDEAAKKKIEEVEKLIADKKAAEEQEKKFNELVAKAQEAFGNKDYTNAKMNYQKALDIKDDEAIKKKIKEIEDLIAKNQNEAEQQAKYDAAIKEADDAYNSDDFETALAKYEEAYAIKEEQYAKDRIAKVKEKLAELADKEAQEKKFNDLIAAGDEFAEQEKYQEAINKYKEAVDIKPDLTISKKIVELEKKLKEQAEQNEVDSKYQAKIDEADAAFNNSSWNEAKALYQDALDIKPNESYPKTKLDEIDKKMKEESKSEVEEQYQKIISKADGLKKEEKFEDAISYYERAISLKSDDPYPKKQIEEIKNIIEQRKQEQADKEAFEKKYNDLIASGDKAFGNKEYEKALKDFKEAVGMKPDENYPQEKIDEINKILQEQSKDAAKEAEYQAAIDKADKLFNEKNWKEAKSAYENALTIIPSKQYPKDQIKACNDKMQAESVDEEEEQYQKILTVAQKKFDEKDYERALELYERAKSIRPSDPVPQQRIDEINQLLKDLANEKEKRARFDALIQEADTYFERKKWQEALKKYMDALDLYDEQYPRDQVEKVREALKNTGDNANKQYQKLIKKADEYFNAQNYEKAKGLYERAVGLKPSDQYPKDMLEKIKLILNPPKNENAVVLKDYGPNTNQRDEELEKILREAKEEAEYIEVEKVYEQREEADEALKNWSEAGTEETFRTKEKVEEIDLALTEMKWSGEEARVETREQVDEWREGINKVEGERTEYHENDIQFQRKKIEAMEIEMTENNLENDKPREQFEMDVEKIKLEVKHKTGDDAEEQTDVIYKDKTEIDIISETHVTNDPNNDQGRMQAEKDVAKMEIEYINEMRENVWDQEDEIMETKDYTEEMIDDIQAEELDNDIPRQETEVKVEKFEEANERKEGERMDEQIDNNYTAKNEIEDLTLEIEANKLGDDEPRQKTEVEIVDHKDHLNDVTSQRSADQTDVIMSNDKSIEKIEITIQEENADRDENREEFEETMEEKKVEIKEFQGNLAKQNEDDSYETKDHTEKMVDQQAEFLEEVDEKAEKQADKFKENVEEHIEHIGDNEKENEEARQENIDYIEELKDIDVRNITPELENELGEKFPEGVTEETYTINDENGLLKSYIVRRVVVQNGVGKVYEKVRTRYGSVSYTKNGQPITEYQWSDETSAAGKPKN